MKPPRNISRIDQEDKSDHAWVVTIQRKGTSVVKRFPDAVHGGTQEALKAAVKYRDALLAEDDSFGHQIWVRTRLRKNNKSGIVGVHRHEIVNPVTEYVREYWAASWTNEHGVTRSRKFSINRYGEEEAKRLAIAEREYQLNRVCDINTAARSGKGPSHARILEATQERLSREGRALGKVETEPEEKPGIQRGDRVQVIEAVIDKNGNVKLMEPVQLTSARRALVTILAEGRGPGPEA